MTRFQTSIESHQGSTVYVLRDLQSQACARIIPAFGANCMELKLHVDGHSEPVAFIDDLQFIPKLQKQASRYGIPVLFPWPSGIEDGTFQFRNDVVNLNEPGFKTATHHGFVNTAAWRVLRSDCDNTGAWLTCSIDSKDCTGVARRFPFSCRLEMTWKLAAEGFQILMEVKNTGTSAMPMGIGLHPYFSLPFGGQGNRKECRLAADVGRQWDLDAIMNVGPEDAAPGRLFLASRQFDPTPQGGTPIAAVDFNHVFEASFDSSKLTTASVIDPANDLKLTVSASKGFATWVIYNPSDRNVLSLEPWTLTPNGFNLAAAGVDNSGMLILEPGEEWTGEVQITAEPSHT